MISAQKKVIFITGLLWILKIKDFRQIIGNVFQKLHNYNLWIYNNKGEWCRVCPVEGFCNKDDIWEGWMWSNWVARAT